MTLQKKKRVLLLVETSRSFGRQIIQGVSNYVRENRDWSFFFQNRDFQERFPNWLKDWDGDGIISRSSSTTLDRQLRRKKIPFVELQGDGRTYFPSVCCHEELNCRMAAEHFIQRGLRHFAYFSLGHTNWSIERYECFRAELRKQGYDCSCSPTVAPESDSTLSVVWYKGCEEEIYHWLETLPRPLAVFCPWDMQAFFFMNLCQIFGISVPDEISVLGYGNNMDLCQASDPPLSSIAPNAQQIGYEAAALLDRLMEHKPLPKLPIRVQASHIATRQSTDATAVRHPLVARGVGFIRDHIAANPNLDDLARFLKVSRSTVNRLFRQWLGRSPNEEIIRVRMEWAQELLRETDFAVGTIALQLHYSSIASFGLAFKNYFGLSPQDYRRKSFK